MGNCRGFQCPRRGRLSFSVVYYHYITHARHAACSAGGGKEDAEDTRRRTTSMSFMPRLSRRTRLYPLANVSVHSLAIFLNFSGSFLTCAAISDSTGESVGGVFII